MSVDKGVPFGFPLWNPREQRGRRHWEARRRGKARGPGSHGQAPQAPAPVCFLPDLGSRGSPVQEKMWIPWNGLVVIGKRMDLLDRDKQKHRKPKPETEEEETLRRTKSGLTQERNVRLLHQVAVVLQSTVNLVKASPKEVWGKQEVGRKTSVSVGSAGSPTGSRRLSGLKDTPRFPRVRATPEDMRPRGHKAGPNEEELIISGGKLRLNEDKGRNRAHT